MTDSAHLRAVFSFKKKIKIALQIKLCAREFSKTAGLIFVERLDLIDID